MKWLIRLVLLIVIPAIGFMAMPVPPRTLYVVVAGIFVFYQGSLCLLRFWARRSGIQVEVQDDVMPAYTFHHTPRAKGWEEFRERVWQLWALQFIFLASLMLLIGEMVNNIIFRVTLPH